MNKYQILGVVGEGAYGVVLKCQNKENDEIIKPVRSIGTESARIGCINKLPKKNYFDNNSIAILFFLTGSNYQQQEQIRKIVHQLLVATQFCHQNEIVHRDIKPENLLVTNSGVLQLCDFGFARVLPGPKSNELLTDYVATRWYRAPQLLLSCQTYGKGVDMWAIACIMCELIDGQPLFPGENEIDQLYLIQQTIGPLTAQQQEIFQQNPRFLGMKFPEITKPETIQRRYLGQLSKKALNFIKSLLQMDPQERLTVEEALNHPYFEGLTPQQPESVQASQIIHVKRLS